VHVECAICSKGFEASRSTAKYCSPRCRQVARRGRVATDDSSQHQSELVATIRNELERLKAIDTVDGQLAIELAIKITTPGMTGVAGLSKELRSVRSQIRAAAAPPAPSGPKPKDMVAEARKKREQKTRQAQTRRA
jgi:hypothetical protein